MKNDYKKPVIEDLTEAPEDGPQPVATIVVPIVAAAVYTVAGGFQHIALATTVAAITQTTAFWNIKKK